MKDYKFIFCKHKAYFETGGSVLKYFLYLIAFFGMSSQDVSTTMTLAIVYAFACYFFGMLWFKYGWFEASIEVSNYFNKFVREMRETYKSKRFK